jgi:hypothetical protein
LLSWRLVSISMDSPLSLTAEPFSDIPGTPVDAIARQEKAALSTSLHEMTTAGHVPEWTGNSLRKPARSFFLRHMNGIGRTDVRFNEHEAPIVIVERSARIAASALEQAAQEKPPAGDLTRTEIGLIEGQVIEATTFYGQPAIRVKDRLTSTEVTCILSAELAERVGPLHDWNDVWRGRHVSVSGEIFYRQDGTVTRVRASEILNIDASQLEYADIADPNFTGGLSPADYVRTLWEEEVG